MKFYVGITDYTWFNYLLQEPDIDEVNFWQPSGNRQFKVLEPGEIFIFKLHSKDGNFVVGYGTFAYSTILPISIAWESFGKKNGAQTFDEMRARVEKYRGSRSLEDYKIGCIMLKKPIFLERERWFKIPDWKQGIQQGSSYTLASDTGKMIWDNLQNPQINKIEDFHPTLRYGTTPTSVYPRLGQGTFRIMVLDKYERKCAVTGEKVLPVLHSAHIKPYSQGGEHLVKNGILLREDIHKLFDIGYVTVSQDYRFEVSKRIQEDFNNGKNYYDLHGKTIYVPQSATDQPDKDILKWHNEKVFH